MARRYTASGCTTPATPRRSAAVCTAKGFPTYEADVRFAYRYLIDRGIKSALRIHGAARPLAEMAPDAARETVVFDEPEVGAGALDAATHHAVARHRDRPRGAAPAVGGAVGVRHARGAAAVPGRRGARRLPGRCRAVCQRGGFAGDPVPAGACPRPRRGDRLEHHRLRRAGADPPGGRAAGAPGTGPRPGGRFVSAAADGSGRTRVNPVVRARGARAGAGSAIRSSSRGGWCWTASACCARSPTAWTATPWKTRRGRFSARARRSAASITWRRSWIPTAMTRNGSWSTTSPMPGW